MKYYIRKAIASIALFSVIMIPGPGDWTTSQKDNQRSSATDESLSGGLKIGWSRHTDSNFRTPLSQNGILYITETRENGFTITAIKRSTGTQLWQYNGSWNLSDDIIVYQDYLIIPGSRLTCLDVYTGQQIWQQESSISPYSFPTAMGNYLYIWQQTGANDFNYYSLFLDSGSTKWSRQFFSVRNVNYSSISNNEDIYVLYNGLDGRTYINNFSADGELFMTSYQGQSLSPLVLSNNDFGSYLAEGGKIVYLDSYEVEVIGEEDYGDFTSIPSVYNDSFYFLSRTLVNNEISLHSMSVEYDFSGDNPYIFDHKQKDMAANEILARFPDPVQVGEQIIIPGNGGEIWRTSFLDGLKKYRSGYSGLEKLIFTDHEFVGLTIDHKDLFSFTFDPSVQEKEVSFDSPYQTGPEYHEYLGQLHSHYIPDIKIPGQKVSPSTTVNKYKNAGYNFIALTEHNQIISNPEVNGITFIENSEEDTQGWGGNHILAVGINSSIDQYLHNQERIDQILDQNGFSILAHPNSALYPWNLNELLRVNNYSSIEIYSSGIDKTGKYLEIIKDINPLDNAYSLDKWDKLLTARKKVLATVGDDYTPNNPGFDNAAVAVFAKENTQDEIMDNLKKGNYYLMQGTDAPHLGINSSNSQIDISSNEDAIIKFIGKNGQILQESNARESSYIPVGDEVYVRVEVIDDDGNKSWTQPVFINLKESAEKQGDGSKTVSLSNAILQADTTVNLGIQTVGSEGVPSLSPAWGYLSPVYNIFTEGVLNSANLSISYQTEDISVNEDSLGIFTYNNSENLWERVESTVDKINKKVTATLNHFSLYTLSSDIANDTLQPEISVINPEELSKVSGETEILIKAEDDNSVFNVSGYLDKNITLFSDSDVTDGFNNQVDFARYPIGNHKLGLIATDTFGNKSEISINIKIEAQTGKPQIKILSKRQGKKNECVNFRLSVASHGDRNARSVQIFSGNTLLGEVDLTDKINDKTFILSENINYRVRIRKLANFRKRIARITQVCALNKSPKPEVILF